MTLEQLLWKFVAYWAFFVTGFVMYQWAFNQGVKTMLSQLEIYQQREIAEQERFMERRFRGGYRL